MNTNIVVFFLFAIASCTPTVPQIGTEVGNETSTSVASGVVEVPCLNVCPAVMPDVGDYCDPILDQYCEYAGETCKFASCNSSTAQWEVGDLNPCICYAAPTASIISSTSSSQ